MKNRLQQFQSLNREIDNSIERLEMLQMKAVSPSSMNLTGTPKKSPSIGDALSYKTSYIVDLENEIKQMIERRDQEERFIESLVKKLDKPDERFVIRLRYLDGEEWNDVIMLLFGNKPDYDINYDNYKQRVYRLHRSAIDKLSALKP